MLSFFIFRKDVLIKEGRFGGIAFFCFQILDAFSFTAVFELVSQDPDGHRTELSVVLSSYINVLFLVFVVTYDQCIDLIILEVPDNLHSCFGYQVSDPVFIVQDALSVSLCRDELLL